MGISEISPTWAESAEFNCVSADGASGFLVRLARYPGARQAWLWLCVWLPDAIYAYNDDTLALTGYEGVTRVDASDVTYALSGDASATLCRLGSPESLSSVTAAASAPAHRADHPPVGSGAAPIRIEAVFTPLHTPRTRMRGRSEVLGTASGTVWTPRGALELSGGAHWHEQHGERPRFANAFTYVTLRGADAGILTSRGPRAASGFVVRAGATASVATLEIDPPAASRAFRATLEDGSAVSGVAHTVHSFSMSIEGVRRPGTTVVAETTLGRLSGVINDWQPA